MNELRIRKLLEQKTETEVKDRCMLAFLFLFMLSEKHSESLQKAFFSMPE